VRPIQGPYIECAGALASRPGGRRGRLADEETARWLSELSGPDRVREAALARLHTTLLRAARAELARRAGRHPVTGPELDDLAHQSADDALLAITAKLGQFRGESRFTTWAYRFVILEVSGKLGRHFWQRPAAALEPGDRERLLDRFGISPGEVAEQRELIAAVQRAVEEDLTDRQRQVFTALVVDGIPLDALVVRLGSSRNALYKTMFDARRKLRAVLAANGYLTVPAGEAGRGERDARRG
jgi:RNA polymerase sigma-70 factor, ECF subfamily